MVAGMFLILLAACDDAHTPGGGSFLPGVELGALTVTVDPLVPNVLHASWEGVPGKSRVQYGLDGAFDEATPWGEGSTFTVLGLKSGHTYSLRADTVTDDGDEVYGEPVSVDIAYANADLPEITIEDADPDAWAGRGFTLLSIFQGGGSWLAMVDRDGDYVWMLPDHPQEAIPTAHITPDGLGIIYVDNDFKGYGWGGMGHVTFDLTVNEYRELDAIHHDAIQLPDGSYAWLQMETRQMRAEDGNDYLMTSDAVYDAPTFDGEPRKVFSMFDDYGHPPWHVCSHTLQEVPVAGGEDFTHGNSLVYDAWDDAYLYNAKHLDTLIALDRGTGKIDWQAGGRYGDFIDLDGDVIDPVDTYDVDGPHRTWWSHAHLSDVWEDGFVLYDNGSHHEPLISRVAAYDWDTSAHTLRRTFSFGSETGVYDPILGDVRRLDNGNYLTAWTMVGMITELTPDGRVVWRLTTSLGSAIGRIGYVPSLYGPEP